MSHALTLAVVLAVSGPLIPSGSTKQVASDTLAIPAQFDTAIGLYEQFFPGPEFTAEATAEKGDNVVSVTAKVGPFSKTFDVPYALPGEIQTFISDLEAAGYEVALSIDAKVA